MLEIIKTIVSVCPVGIITMMFLLDVQHFQNHNTEHLFVKDYIDADYEVIEEA